MRRPRRCPHVAIYSWMAHPAMQCTLPRDHAPDDYLNGHRYDVDDVGYADWRRFFNRINVWP